MPCVVCVLRRLGVSSTIHKARVRGKGRGKGRGRFRGRVRRILKLRVADVVFAACSRDLAP